MAKRDLVLVFSAICWSDNQIEPHHFHLFFAVHVRIENRPVTNPDNIIGFQKEKLGNQSTRLSPFPCSARFFLCGPGQFVSDIIHSAFQYVLKEMRIILVVQPSGDKKRTEVDVIIIT